MCRVEILVLFPPTLRLPFSIQFWRNILHKRRLYKHCGTNSATLEFWQMTFNNSIAIQPTRNRFLLLIAELKLV